eukprot:gnl/TRDRNA2_/TRDRNA2_160468_c0_seq2.p1 gnl/TRDRNA2_/TRDRNA2_160468_c0~~gnl/TRDRNA2_/TRDRNA2_160468_c0_seq2.p1  ORF type:complete len:294 (-),score=48.07 gnl/TRDRNA2_/TRDRNA2_160468_c0_seq2:40-921(-)
MERHSPGGSGSGEALGDGGATVHADCDPPVLPCRVLPGFLGLAVQGLLFACVLAVMVLKKWRERGRRTWFEFCLDGSKQIIGSGWIHILNLLCAIVLNNLDGNGDECEWYWINIMVDTTVGVGVEYILLWGITHFIDLCLSPSRAEDFKTGEYYKDERFWWSKYMKQLSVWLAVVTGMKLSMVMLMIMLADPLQGCAHVFLGWFANTPMLKLLVVMIATPLFMNAFQFWVVDNFIRKQSDGSEIASATRKAPVEMEQQQFGRPTDKLPAMRLEEAEDAELLRMPSRMRPSPLE